MESTHLTRAILSLLCALAASTGQAKFWKQELAELLRTVPRRSNDP
jgi:hypothetical protein